MRLYHTEFTQPLPEADFSALLSALPHPMREKVLKFRRWQDAHASLLGKHLLMKALEEAGLAPDLDRLQYTPFGRPYLTEAVDFNLSHSGNRVVCLLSAEGPAGVDLEEIRSMQIDDLRNQFCKEEWNAIRTAADPLRLFYSYWTIKESVLKADGRGIHVPPSRIRIGENNRVMLDGNCWHVREVPCFSQYACHVATVNEYMQIEVCEVSFA